MDPPLAFGVVICCQPNKPTLLTVAQNYKLRTVVFDQHSFNATIKDRGEFRMTNGPCVSHSGTATNICLHVE